MTLCCLWITNQKTPGAALLLEAALEADLIPNSVCVIYLLKGI